MSDQRADNYRQQAAEIREAAEIVRDLEFREQLLGIAQQYEAVAARIQMEAHAKRDAGSTFRPAQEAIIVPISTRLYPSSKSARNIRIARRYAVEPEAVETHAITRPRALLAQQIFGFLHLFRRYRTDTSNGIFVSR
jgi:hypothetical protein